MSWFCRHEWKIIVKTYAISAQEKNVSIKGTIKSREDERLIHGQTTIILQCRKCSKIYTKEMLGKEIRLED